MSSILQNPDLNAVYQYMVPHIVEIKKICSPFLKEHNLTHFWYSRFYQNRSLIDLGTDQEWFHFMLQNQYFNNLDSFQFDTTSWGKVDMKAIYTVKDFLSMLPAESFYSIIEKFQVFYIFNIMINRENYLENISFSAPQNNPECLFLYSKYFGLLKSFGIYFANLASELIKDIEQNARIIIPKGGNREFFKEKFLAYNNNHTQEGWTRSNLDVFYLSTPRGDIEISARQRDCLTIFSQGGGYKEAARILNLSPKTIETHIQRLKDKTGLNSLFTLTDAFIQSGL